MKTSRKVTNRRDLFTGVARAVALAAIAGGTALLAWRNGRAHPCQLRNPCASCGQLQSCDLEPATDERREARTR